MKRRPFISSLLGALAVFFTPKPTEAEWNGHIQLGDTSTGGDCEGDSFDPSIDLEGLWPNDKPFPCELNDPKLKLLVPNCGRCRGEHNRLIVSTDLEWYKDVGIWPITGKWHLKYDNGVAVPCNCDHDCDFCTNDCFWDGDGCV